MTATPVGKNSAHYRPDIDGLRAVAVLAVVIYHIKEYFLPGGFAGVDVFFVISGYLITGNLYRGMYRGTFTFKDFYRRRLLRIFPPLIVVVLTTVIVGQFVMLPEDVTAMTQSALAAMLSVANIYFLLFLDTSYFAADASVHPLLHIWSLGVEEQFYVFWPILLLAFLKRGLRGLAFMTLIIGAASFVLAELTVRDNPMFAYYMLPTRAGQLMAGSLVFFMTQSSRFDLPQFARQILAGIGLAVVLASLWFVDGHLPYPGVSALPVTLGTAAIIWVGTNTDRPPLVNRFLGLTPFIWIGLLSYSFYLWHWPVFAYWKYLYGDFTLISGTASVLTALGLSWLTYRFVETRFRRINLSFGKIVNRTFVLPSLAIGAAVAGLHFTNGVGFQKFGDYEAKFASLEAKVAVKERAIYICQRPRLTENDLLDARCDINAGDDQRPSVLLWGDSNAAHYVGMLGSLAEAYGFSFTNLAHSACPPFIRDAGRFVSEKLRKDCGSSAALIASNLDDYSGVILSASWPGHLAESEPERRRALEETLEFLRQENKQVVLLGKTPVMTGADPKCGLKALKWPMLNCAAMARVPITNFTATNAYLKSVADKYDGVSYFDVTDYFCDEKECSAYLDGEYAYFDPGHLNVGGSWSLGNKIIETQGLPAALSNLPKISPRPTSSNRLLQQQLDSFGKDRFENLSNGVSLIDGTTFPQNDTFEWRNTKYGENNSGVFLLEDDSAEKSRILYLTFKPTDIFDLNATGKQISMLLQLELDVPSTTSPVPTLVVRSADPETQYQLDLMVDKKTQEIWRKKLSNNFNAQVKFEGDSLFLNLALERIDPHSEYMIRIPGASTHAGPSYSSQGVGRTAIRSLKIFKED